MQKPLIRLLIWFGIMAILTVLAMGIWLVVWNGNQSTESLKWLQFLQTSATFLIPPILCAWLWDDHHRPFEWLKMNRSICWQTAVLAIVIMICAIPGINLLADLNSRIELPESLASIEQILKQQEEAAAALTERFLQADHIGIMMLNILLMALLPAFAEELSFRGTLQQLINDERLSVSGYRTHIAIWMTAIVFSAIHMQFYGFIPRMLMGAMFGYVFVWTGSLWIPILMHFTNNGIAVLAYYLIGESEQGKNYADTFGAGTTWWVGFMSLIIVGCLLYLLTSQGQRGYDRRTHIQ